MRRQAVIRRSRPAFPRRAPISLTARYLQHRSRKSPFQRSATRLRSLMTNRKLLICAFAALSLVATPLLASAAARLSDQEVKALLESIENKRSAFEGSLDDTLKNSTIKTQRGEIK